MSFSCFVQIHFLLFSLFLFSFFLSSSPLSSVPVTNCSSLLLPPLCPRPPSLPPVSWFLLALSRHLLSPTSSRSYCSLWWSGRSSGCRTRSAAVAQDQSFSPGHVRLISGLSGLVLARGTRAVRGVWVVDACCPEGGARVEGAL